MSYEIHAWIVLFTILSIYGLTQFYTFVKKLKQPKKEKEVLNDKIIVEVVKTDNELDNLSITDKLLQNIDAEQRKEEVLNKIELMEKEWYTSEVDLEGLETILKKIPQEPVKNEIVSPEIYNTNTNLEQINKQKTQFEFLRNEIELYKAKWNDVEYEKKLIQATIDFPDDYYFNGALWDRYMEREDYKKAQTLFKKLHLQNENDDKILYKLGIINLELNDLNAAEFLLTKAKDLKPENPKYYQSLAEVKYSVEKIDESIELMEKAVDLRPTKFEYIEILWKLYKETDNIQLYYKTLLKMNALEPLNQRVRWELSKFQD